MVRDWQMDIGHCVAIVRTSCERDRVQMFGCSSVRSRIRPGIQLEGESAESVKGLHWGEGLSREGRVRLPRQRPWSVCLTTKPASGWKPGKVEGKTSRQRGLASWSGGCWSAVLASMDRGRVTL